MIPDEPYYSPFNAKEKVIITPEEGRRQAAIIANTIVNAVYDKLIEIYHETGYLPTGGNLGNYRSVFYPNFFFWKKSKQAQMQCQDWTELLYKAIEPVLELHFKRNVNSFQMNWHTKMPFFGYSSDKAFIPFNFGEHNWIRLIGPLRKSAIMIDPWESGGRYFIEKNYEVCVTNFL